MIPSTILHPNAPANRTRTVFCFAHFGDKPPEHLPPSTDDPSWKPWHSCKAHDIASGMIAQIAAHRAFRDSGGPGHFTEKKSVTLILYLFDPATDKSVNGRIRTCKSTTFRFFPV